MRIARIGIGLALATLFAALLAWSVDLREAARAASLVSAKVLVMAVLLVMVGYSVRAWRWKLMLGGADVEATYPQASSIFFGAFALNNLLPLRAGDVYRCVAAARLPEGTIAKSLAALLTERLLDLGFFAISLGVPIVFFPNPSLELISFPIGVVLIAGLLLIGILLTFPSATRRLVETLFPHSSDRLRIVSRARDWLLELVAAIEGTLAGSALRLRVIGATALSWSLELGVFVLVGSAVNRHLSVTGGLAAGILGTLATLIPGAPGHVGTFDFFATEGFRYGGLSAEEALAAAVVCHIAIVVPVTVYGSIRLVLDRQANA
jgi:hypothetical protein